MPILLLNPNPNMICLRLLRRLQDRYSLRLVNGLTSQSAPEDMKAFSHATLSMIEFITQIKREKREERERERESRRERERERERETERERERDEREREREREERQRERKRGEGEREREERERDRGSLGSRHACIHTRIAQILHHFS